MKKSRQGVSQMGTTEPKAGEGFGLGAHGHAQAGHFGQAAGDQGRAGVQPQLQAVGNAGGDGQHILHRTTHFHADGVGGGVDAQGPAVEGGHGLVAQGGVGAGGHQGGGLTGGHLLREAGAREHAGTQAGRHRSGDLVAQQAGAGFKALAEPEHVGAGGQCGEHAVQAGHGCCRDDQAALGMAQRHGQIGLGTQTFRPTDVGQVAGVDACRLHDGHLGSITGPQQHLVARGRRHGQCGAPGTGAQDAQAHRVLKLS